MPIESPSAELRMGSVEGPVTKIQFSLVVDSSGAGRVRLYMYEPRGRRAGELLDLGERGFAELQEIVDHIKKTVERMKGTGQMLTLDRGT